VRHVETVLAVAIDTFAMLFASVDDGLPDRFLEVVLHLEIELLQHDDRRDFFSAIVPTHGRQRALLQIADLIGSHELHGART
jgi:hypothetical protein